MTFSLGEQRSWYDTYPTDDELAQVRAALTPHIIPRVNLDWEALLALRVEHPHSCQFSHIEEGHAFTSALEQLCGDLRQTQRLDFVPLLLDTPWVDLLDASGRQLRLYAIPNLLDRWRSLERSIRELDEWRMLEYEAKYLQPGSSLHNAAEDPHFDILVGPYCRMKIVQIMRAANSHQVPVRLVW